MPPRRNTNTRRRSLAEAPRQARGPAARRARRCRRGVEQSFATRRHRHLRWNSGLASHSARPCWRLSARSIASRVALAERLAVALAREAQRIYAGADARREDAGPLDALPQRVRRRPRPRRCRASPAARARRRAAAPCRASARNSACGFAARAAGSARRQDTTYSIGDFSLASGCSQASGQSSSARVDGRQVAAGVAEGARDARHRLGRRLVGDEVARELGGDVRRGRRMGGKVAQHGLALRHAFLRVGLAEQRPRPRLVPRGIEEESGRALRSNIDRPHGPAREHARELGHVGLRVAAVHAQRVQLEDLAGEVLVEAGGRRKRGAARAPPRLPALAHREVVVEVQDHRRVPRRREQHVGEAPGHVRPDRLALEAADERRRRAASRPRP